MLQGPLLEHGYKKTADYFPFHRFADTMNFLRSKSLSVVAALLLGSSSVVHSQCPDFTTYSATPQGNPSNGTLGLPFMRPAPACRTFNSSAVEKVITDMKARLKDPDVARLFENTFPNTLDTTVKYYNQTENLAFIITGFPLSSGSVVNQAVFKRAQWLRDTANQFAHYRSLLSLDPELAKLVKAVINNEARYITQYPYCGSFQPPPESGLAPTVNPFATDVIVNPPVDNQTVFECKYEIDSLCGFLKLSTTYYNETKDASIMNDNWFSAIDQIFQVINNQSQGTWDENFNFISYYNWTGVSGSLAGPVNNQGNGEPKAYTGMVGTHHRPSDDLSTYAFLTPANAMLTVELTNLAHMLDSAGKGANISESAKEWSSRINESIWTNTLVDNIFAYETNGYGGRYVMDDANVPSLLSLPYLGFLKKDNPAYVASRKLLLSRKNPYFAAGQNFSGIGGPHVDPWNPWPMSQVAAIFGTDDDEEILNSLYLIVNNTDGLGLIHESVSIYNESDFTRTWFAWANSFFAEMLLDLADRKPGKEAVSVYRAKHSHKKKKQVVSTGLDNVPQALRNVRAGTEVPDTPLPLHPTHISRSSSSQTPVTTSTPACASESLKHALATENCNGKVYRTVVSPRITTLPPKVATPLTSDARTDLLLAARMIGRKRTAILAGIVDIERDGYRKTEIWDDVRARKLERKASRYLTGEIVPREGKGKAEAKTRDSKIRKNATITALSAKRKATESAGSQLSCSSSSSTEKAPESTLLAARRVTGPGVQLSSSLVPEDPRSPAKKRRRSSPVDSANSQIH
ncbi:hypothetical protein D9757_000199 [Collybiopsis confluens]|uniref:Glycoside hydrolase family 125 protein n=1 Tax=Collybiopsis confluens TaxID=2823264 RepID=A0A8H5MHD7_9AGAR|nr:hypothetical protein D9757_000199 [Collybiopsis confluens]